MSCHSSDSHSLRRWGVHLQLASHVVLLLLCMCVLNFSTLVSYGVDLVAKQQLGSALEWALLLEGEEKEEDGAGLGDLAKNLFP